jgi:hypothetical protein
MSVREGHDDHFRAELEQALSEAFAVKPDPFRQVAIRAQVIAEMREIHSAKTVQGALGRVYAVQPSAHKYEHYRRLAMAAVHEPVLEKESFFARARALFRGSNHNFERRLNDCIDDIVGGRATTNECLQRYPEDADRLAPLLGMAFQLRSEYASLPFEQRLSGVRWRVQRASQKRDTTPLAGHVSGGGFLRNLQWAAPLTTGVAASFLLAFLVFQTYLSDGGDSGSPQAGNPQVPVQGNPRSFAALQEAIGDNEYLTRFDAAIERVETAVLNEQPPAPEDIEALTQQTSELQEQIEAGGLEGEERRAAANLAVVAANTLEAAEPLVGVEEQELLVTSQELIQQLNNAIASTALPGSNEGNEEQTAEPTAEPTEEPADDGEGDEEPAGDGEDEDEEVTLAELVDGHRALSEQLAAGVVIDRALFRAYRQSLDDLQEAIESEEGAADEEFLTTTLELLGLDEVSLNGLLETYPTFEEQLSEALTRRTEVYDAAEQALSDLQNGAEDEEATADEEAD